jgi:hypothetical protein
MENSGFIRNYRNLTAQPTSVVGGVGSIFGWKPKKEYKQVYGFEQDKENYGDERDGSKLQWEKKIARNNDTGEELEFEVGYDDDNNISGIREHNAPGSVRGYYGKELVSDFFKNNFDRDATDYTIFTDKYGNDTREWVAFDSKLGYGSNEYGLDGAFVPSAALSRGNYYRMPSEEGGEGVQYDTELPYHYGEELQPSMGKDFNVPSIDTEDKQYDPAFNGTLFPTRMSGGAPSINNWGKLYSNVNGFLKDLHDIAFTEDKAKRRLMIDAALFNWGGSEVFSGILGNMKYLESLEDKGQYEGTYDPEKDYAYAKDYIWGLVKKWEDQTFHNA